MEVSDIKFIENLGIRIIDGNPMIFINLQIIRRFKNNEIFTDIETSGVSDTEREFIMNYH
jgi:hypothetical protein